jgi:hypothetical protein
MTRARKGIGGDELAKEELSVQERYNRWDRFGTADSSFYLVLRAGLSGGRFEEISRHFGD